ncbi:MAG: hypothetical protein UR73_C0038G0014 [candidate division WS6 bacterium GW2011_GWF1_35_23]|uniref:Uncharacterized protein n=1 Tax=candidate division WS6 bacterium GW2011_GWF1_35_23 TaxID=1619097 RepID=A0A0G0CEX7_9BACT|nr:MAG: hypothetical protein UR73_C0038G0014 [candidate division WS6 bacterium GW2011_GWF1_35_23]KKQ29798.1 MAG: hypothetical protein US46_C0017G0014 [Candidatus Shapirobacteria bacterium GW2011_GWF2_37_20]
MNGIGYVAKANYAERESEAIRLLENAMYGDDSEKDETTRGQTNG